MNIEEFYNDFLSEFGLNNKLREIEMTQLKYNLNVDEICCEQIKINDSIFDNYKYKRNIREKWDCLMLHFEFNKRTSIVEKCNNILVNYDEEIIINPKEINYNKVFCYDCLNYFSIDINSEGGIIEVSKYTL